MSLQEKVLIKRLESSMDSRDFWNDSLKIESYANTILKDFGSLSLVTVRTGSYFSTPQCSRNTVGDGYLINVPILKDSYEKTNEEKFDIFKRRVFLRHELAHIMYTPFHLFVKHKKENFYLYNALEDVRIEYLFGKRFEGSNDAFFNVQKKYYEESLKAISTNPADVSMLGLYFLYRSKDFDFSQYENSSSIAIYESLYQKYRRFIYEPSEELFHLCDAIKIEFDEIMENSKESQAPKEQSFSMPDESQNDETSEEKEYQGEDFDNQESDDEADDTEESFEDYSDDNDSDPIDTPSSYEDMIKDMFEENNNDVEDDFENYEKDELGNITIPISELYSDVTLEKTESLLRDLANEIDSSTKSIKFELSKMKKVADIEIDIERALSDLIYDSKKEKVYDVMRKNNKKHIAYIVNFLKLKFQKKEVSRLTRNKEEGIIENEKLWKILQKKNIDGRIFSKIESAVVSKANVIIVLDFSGSMSGDSIRALLESLVILIEVMTKLETPFKIFSFTTGNSVTFRKIKVKESKILERNLKNCVIKDRKNLELINYADSNEMQLCIKYDDRNSEKNNHYFKLMSDSLSYQKIKNSFNILYSNIVGRDKKIIGVFGSGTNELETMISIYDKYRHIKNTKVFLVNDGIYSDLSQNFYSNNFSYVKDSEIYKNVAVSREKLYAIYSYFKIHKKTFYVDNVETAKHMSKFIHNCAAFSNFTRTSEFASFKTTNLGALGRDLWYFSYMNVLYSYDEKKGKYGLRIDDFYDVNPQLLATKWHWYGRPFKNKNVELTETNGVELTLVDFLKICFFMNDTTKQNANFGFSIGNVIYRSLIEAMKGQGWEVYGIGIYSPAGKEYIGEKNFTYIEDIKDLKNNFSKKLKMGIAA